MHINDLQIWQITENKSHSFFQLTECRTNLIKIFLSNIIPHKRNFPYIQRL